jgi:hypothetical protein
MVVGTVIFTADGVEYIYIFGCPYLTMLVEAPSTINLNDPSRVPLCFECLKYAQTEFKHSHTDNKALYCCLIIIIIDVAYQELSRLISESNK